MMHPCLQVYDILECICSHLTSTNSFDALAKLARTCTTFVDPALNALWQTIPTLEPLVRCLPEDAWAVKCARYHPVMTLTRKTTPEDWTRCAFYTHRIRHFGSSELEHSLPGQAKGSLPTDKTVYMALRPSTPSSDVGNTTVPPLTFPKLRSCRLVQHTSSPIPHYTPFLAQTLISLEIRPPMYDSDEFLLGILRSIPSSSPFLRKLEIQGVGLVSAFEVVPSQRSETRTRPSETLMGMLYGSHHLESLICPCIHFSNDAVRYIATRMKTRVLHIKNSVENILEAISGEGECFEYLEQLAVECGPDEVLGQCTKLLMRVANVHNLESLEVWKHGGSPAEFEVRNFIQAFYDLTTPTSVFFHKHPVPNTTLKKLFIHQTPLRRRIPARGYTITLDTLEPLLSFPLLTNLSITTDNRYAFNDADACKMARAWPRLRELQLGFSGTGWGRDTAKDGEGRLTLEGLKSFGRWCKEMKKLGVCFDMNAQRKEGGGERLEEETGDVSDAVQCCSLRFLEVGDSVYYDEPQQVAKSLLDIFPNLRGTFGPDAATSVEWQKKWMYVTRAVGAR